MTSDVQPPLPSLTTLGRDLLTVSHFDIALSLLRPAVCFALFWLLAATHHYGLAVFPVAGLMFFTYTSTSHDLVHKTLHLPDNWNEILLALMEGVCLRSGHAFRLTHLQHHKHFPDSEDIEAADAARGFWPALLSGPASQVLFFRWAWRHGNPNERAWMCAEAVFVLAGVGVALAVARVFPALLFYCALVVLASWLYPLATVWWPHRASGETPLQQTVCFRGRIIPVLFFQHTYHLEHHLYPGVSSHRWAELGRRLEPFLKSSGVEFVRLP